MLFLKISSPISRIYLSPVHNQIITVEHIKNDEVIRKMTFFLLSLLKKFSHLLPAFFIRKVFEYCLIPALDRSLIDLEVG